MILEQVDAIETADLTALTAEWNVVLSQLQDFLDHFKTKTISALKTPLAHRPKTVN
jgi:hypothetical protein